MVPRVSFTYQVDRAVQLGQAFGGDEGLQACELRVARHSGVLARSSHLRRSERVVRVRNEQEHQVPELEHRADGNIIPAEPPRARVPTREAEREAE